MAAFLGNLRNVTIASFVLALLLVVLYGAVQGFDGPTFELFTLRWLHVVCGVMWIGLLWYFNFVSTPTMPKIPDELKPALGRFITPAALFWFRWGAMSTIVTGLILAWMNGYIVQALSVQKPFTAIGLGMWFGIVMWFNVWFIIWPAQKKALGIVTVPAEEKTAAARKAMLTSRFNTMLSVPMLYFMVAQQNAGL